MQPDCQQVLGLLAVGREVQIGEQHLAAPELLALDGERLLDLYDQLRLGRIRCSASAAVSAPAAW